MGTPYSVILIDSFAEPGICALAQHLVCRLKYVPSVLFSKMEAWPQGVVLPFFVCETKEVLRKHGIKAPREFIIERQDLLTNDMEDGCESPYERMRQRVDCILGAESGDGKPTGIEKKELKLWFEGWFRSYCFQDKNVHGGGTVLKLPQKEVWLHQYEDDAAKKWVEGTDDVEGKMLYPFVLENELLDRFLPRENSAPPLGNRRQMILHYCFMDEYDEIGAVVSAFRSEKSEKQEADCIKMAWAKICIRIAKCLHKLSVVPESGMPIRYLSPTTTINVLLIDDEAIDIGKRIQDRFKPIFDVKPLQIKRGESGKWKVEDEKNDHRPLNVNSSSAGMPFGEMLRGLGGNGKTFDIVLLDLCLNSGRGADMEGYHLIKIIKYFLPQVPVIAYSQYDDMGHVVRALQSGASWFLKKSETWKLPRHVFTLLTNREWNREWQTMAKMGLGEIADWPESKANERSFRRKLTQKQQYLTCKCLEKYPGKTIFVKSMAGDNSSSVTFQAAKGARTDDGWFLQTPVIVKIDSAFSMRLEYERYFRFIRPYIANECGRVENPERVIDDENAAIVYTFAGKQDKFHELVSMRTRLIDDIASRASCDYEKYRKAFDVIFDEILPRIHGVTIGLEFYDGDVPSDGGRSLKPIEGSDFPNCAFGEVDGDFLANYLCRMPVCRELKNPQFVSQKAAESDVGTVTAYEFACSHKSRGACSIDAFDRSNKCTVMMTGPSVDHVVRYRPHSYPSMSLWVKDAAAPTETLSKTLGETLIIDPGVIRSLAKAVGQMPAEVVKELGCSVSYTPDGLASPCSAGQVFSKLVQELLKVEGVLGNGEGQRCDSTNNMGIFGGGQISKNGWLPCWDEALKRIESDKVYSAFWAIPKLVDLAQMLLRGTLKSRIEDCPKGIVHGDVNLDNIMLEFRKRWTQHAAFTDDNADIQDVWMIGFARTRRDYIVHDFSVMFTSVLGLLFDKNVWMASKATFKTLICNAVFGRLDAVPDDLADDLRLAFIYRMLRRIRVAALRAHVSKEAYALAVALDCMVAARVSLIWDCNAPASAAMIATAFICLDRLKRMEIGEVIS